MVAFLVLIGKANRDTEFHQEPDHALCECQALFLTIVPQLGSSWSSERRSHARHKDLHYILETFFFMIGEEIRCKHDFLSWYIMTCQNTFNTSKQKENEPIQSCGLEGKGCSLHLYGQIL